MTAKTPSPLTTQRWTRWLLVLLILLAFTRLVWRLDAKNLWLDESFSLQRAESSWADLIRGIIPISDGVHTVRTIDQHPPAFFIPLGLAVRLLGQSEFALRLPSTAAATLFLPICWALARRLARRGSVPPAAPAFAALLAAVSPFYLWYGQEVRMYAQVGFLALLSLYLLVRWAQAGDRRSQLIGLLGYLVVMLALLSSHYYSVLVLPVQAAVVGARLIERNRRWALIAAGVFGVGAVLVFLAARPTMMQGGAGSNFASVSPSILGPDLVNAFTLGLSVDLARVWPLDALSAALAIMGAVWGLRSRSVIARGGWLLPAFVLVPALLLLGLNVLRPAYMNARHMSLISGGYLLLLSAGLAWLWQFRRWAAGVVMVLLVGGMIYSTVNYYTAPPYDKGDMAGMGQLLDEKMQPGDLLLIEPSVWGRLFRYYLPMDDIERWQQAGQLTGWRALPPLSGSQPREFDDLLASLRGQYRRIWLARSVPDSEVAASLQRGTFRTQDWGFESPLNYLHLELFQIDPPVIDRLPAAAQPLTDVTFENGISLRGYEVGQPFQPGRAIPITLYWQVAEPSDRRYKYILRWIVRGDDGAEHVLATTEKEPYDGLLPTSVWTPGTTIREYTNILPPADTIPGESYLSLQMYDAETLQKSPVRSAAGVQADASDGDAVILPLAR
jgi:4-amino-4-deoxy-L-arabinose transferase-like glycosyltransferase